MERPERRRSLEGLAGPSESVRGCYRCRTCGHHAAVADVVLSIGPGALTRASAGAALLAAQDPCGQAARVLNDTSAPT